MAQVEKLICTVFAHRLALARKQMDHTVEPLVATTSPQRPVFQNTNAISTTAFKYQPNNGTSRKINLLIFCPQIGPS